MNVYANRGEPVKTKELLIKRDCFIMTTTNQQYSHV